MRSSAGTCCPTRARPPVSPRPGASRCRCSRPGDRRAALRALWSPFLPDACWETDHPAARRVRARVPGRERLDVRRDAAHRRAARTAHGVHPPAVLGLQQRRRARPHRAGAARRRHHRRHQHELRARARGPHAAACGHRGHRRLHRTAHAGAGGSHRRHAPARHRHARRQRPSCFSAPAFPTPSSRGCRHDPHERSRAPGTSGQVLRPGRRRHRGRRATRSTRAPTARSR